MDRKIIEEQYDNKYQKQIKVAGCLYTVARRNKLGQDTKAEFTKWHTHQKHETCYINNKTTTKDYGKKNTSGKSLIGRR